MAITNYEPPHLEIHQILDTTVATSGDHSNVCVVGPQYDLYRYGHEEIEGTPFKSAGDTINLEYTRDEAIVTYTVDVASVGLYGVDLFAATSTAAVDADIKATSPYVISVSGANPGDIIHITNTVDTGVTKEVMAKIVSATADSATVDKTPLTASQIASGEDVTVSVKLGYMYTGPISTSATSKTAVTYAAALTVNGHPLENNIGTVYPEFRVQKSYPSDDEVIEITTSSDITKHLGEISQDNPIAYGVFSALLGGQGNTVYALRTSYNDGDEVGAFANAMAKTENDSRLYAFAPMTKNIEAAKAVVAFNDAMSQPETMMWRTSYIGVDSAKASELTTITGIQGTISKGDNGSYITFTGDDINLYDLPGGFALHSGDSVASSSKTYIVKEVISEKIAQIVDTNGNPVAAVAEATSYTITKANTPATQIEYISGIAKGFNNRRVNLVWTDAATNDGVVTDNMYLAAEIAGYACYVAPNKPISRYEVTSVTKATRMYTLYSNSDLNAIAANGVMIITQNTKNDACFLRHQLTTATDGGILYYENSCTRNLDSISYAIADILREYYGRYNVVQQTLNTIYNSVLVTLDKFTSDATDVRLGPSLVEFSNLSVQQDPVFADRAIVRVRLAIPAPLNQIVVYEMAYVATGILAAIGAE